MAMANGVAPEQARLFLPAYGMYVIYRWSCSLQSACLFVNQRLKEDAQKEIQTYAQAVNDFILNAFPVSAKVLIK
jgi:thymidylate synthase (FAD)